ncbi:hypothetical protein REPUB_Repub20aG0074500 [Reevesia pubescens]
MANRFTNIINGLKALHKTYSNTDMANKVFSSLLNSWEAKVTTIEELNNLNTLSLNELIGSLITYEIEIKHREIYQNKYHFKEYGVAFNSINGINKD